ncbi:hypothetical protein ABK905_22605 [Acerihabitans sp. KWT182]|uniref:Uncharacterized protein n=1 Tax=Acerihabitans sp. KWT182 TaxID=3157919 RepID=A0AAU7Q8H9_9GAMM
MSEQNDKTAPAPLAAENADGSLAGPASYLLSQVSEFASQLMKKTLDGATVGGGTALAGGGAAVIEGGATALSSVGAVVEGGGTALASIGTAAEGGGTALAPGGAAAAGGEMLKFSGDAAASGSLAVLTAVGINHATRQEAGAADAVPANDQSDRTAESLPSLTLSGDIAELPALQPNEHIIPPAVKQAPERAALPDVNAKPGKAESPVIKPAQIFEAVEIARPVERVKSHHPRPKEKAPQSRTPLAKPGQVVVQVDVHAPMTIPEKTADVEREMPSLIQPVRGEAEISPADVEEPAVNHVQEAIEPAEIKAGLSITPWPIAPTLTNEAIINQCKIRLAAHEEGVLKPYIDSDYYDHVPIYEVVDKSADFSQPVYRHYIEMDGEKVAAKLSSIAGHGIKYTLIDESNSGSQYGLAFDDGRWQLQSHTAEVIDPTLLKVITFDMVDHACSEEQLSAPDERGLQWTADNKAYLRIKGHFVHLLSGKGYINCYIIRSKDGRQALSLLYKDGRFHQLKVPPHEVYKYGLKSTFLRQRSRIKNLLDEAGHELEKK